MDKELKDYNAAEMLFFAKYIGSLLIKKSDKYKKDKKKVQEMIDYFIKEGNIDKYLKDTGEDY